VLRSDLTGAHLTYADLTGANLNYAHVGKAKLDYVTLRNALYAPRSEPPDPYVGGIKDLATVKTAGGRIWESGLSNSGNCSRMPVSAIERGRRPTRYSATSAGTNCRANF
jgi:hypothetical protein